MAYITLYLQANVSIVYCRPMLTLYCRHMMAYYIVGIRWITRCCSVFSRIYANRKIRSEDTEHVYDNDSHRYHIHCLCTGMFINPWRIAYYLSDKVKGGSPSPLNFSG